MYKGIIKTLSVFLSLSLLILIVPFHIVKAEQQTYYELSANTCLQQFQRKSDNYINRVNFSVDVRYCVFLIGSSVYVVYVYNNTDTAKYSQVQNGDGNACNLPNNNMTLISQNNYNFKYYQTNVPTSNFNILLDTTYAITLSSANNLPLIAYDYTYGDLSVGPSQYDFGNVANLGFYTSFVSQNNTAYTTTAPYNKDTISWNPSYSNNNTALDDTFGIEIHAFRYQYTASSLNEILHQTFEDAQLIPSSEINLGTYLPLVGQVSYTWEDIATRFVGNAFVTDFLDELVIHEVNSQFIQKGWVYKARLVNEDYNYTSDWQIIYTTTSIPSVENTIYNAYYVNYDYSYNYQVIDSFNTINSNNNTQNTYFVNQEPININFGDATYNVDILSDNIIGSYNEMHSIELSIFDQLDNELENFELIDIDSDLGANFTGSMNWVNTQFTTALNNGNNQLGQFVYLVVGIGIIFLIVGIIA